MSWRRNWEEELLELERSLSRLRQQRFPRHRHLPSQPLNPRLRIGRHRHPPRHRCHLVFIFPSRALSTDAAVAGDRRNLLFFCGAEPCSPAVSRYPGTAGQSGGS